jgi:predicted HAD superfamily Cof-like phosphohydrolase
VPAFLFCSIRKQSDRFSHHLLKAFSVQDNNRTHPFHDVWKFHETYNLLRTQTPTLPDASTRQLRKDLLQEEYQEYLDGEQNDDLVEIADALGDIIYIAYGTGVAYGLPMDEIFSEIQRSNMSKLGEDGKPIYRDDGKVLKGPNYTRPDIKAILAAYIAKAK